MSIKQLERKIEEKIEIILDHDIERKKLKDPIRKKLIKSVCLSKEQKQKIDNFYKQYYGKKISYKWHRLYTSISGSFDYKYFPESLYSSELQRLTNSPLYESLADKSLFPTIVKGSGINVILPKTYFYKSNNILFAANHQPISKEKALEIVSDNEFFIKPTIGSNSGFGCRLVKKDEISKTDTLDLIVNYGTDYVAQEVIHNQKDLTALNPSSLNTFRIITYFIDGKVFASPVVLRIGMNGSVCDNAHAGGVFCAVNEDGNIVSNGKTNYCIQYEQHPNSKIVFRGYHIENFHKLQETAISLQYLFPRIGVIDWDLTLNEEGEVVVIEANMRGGSVWLIQMSHGKSVFGENTGKVLQIIKEKKKKY